MPTSGAPASAGGQLLAAITAGLSAGDDLGDLLQHFLEPVVRLAGAQGGAVRVLADEESTLQLISGVGVPAGVCGQRQGMDRHCGHCGRAADELLAVWTEDLSACAARNEGIFFGQRCQRMLVLPLQHRGELLGVYNLFFESRQTEPPADVMTLLRTVGDLLGLALHHARLERTQLQATVLRERQSMAAEVHDSIGQSLTFIKMRLPLLEDAMRDCDEPRALRYCAELRETATQAHASLRALLTHLRTPMDPQGLLPALQASAEQFRQQNATQLDFVNELPSLALGPEREVQVFHIVREALANVARHASARHAWLHIGRTEDGAVQVRIEDDGTGLAAPTGAASSHYGLQIMLERAQRLGGALEIGAREGGGTRVRLRIPERASSEAGALP
jgi:two-component system nitrate/nitrite sensor histidine kinase NarX